MIDEVITCRTCGNVAAPYRAGRKKCRPCHNAHNRAYNAEWRANNAEHNRDYHRQYRAENAAAMRAIQRRRYDKKKRDIGAVVAGRVGALVRHHVKKQGGVKSARTEYYLGYPVSRIIAWVKRQGGIPADHHIDHRVPVAWWLARYPDDIVRAMRGAWNLANLRIIPARENIAKGARREFLI